MARVVHFEVHVDDPERARNFYTSVFGWEFTSWEGPEDYWLIKTGDPDQPGIDGGMMKRRDPAGSVYNTLHVEDLDSAMENVKSSGGEIVVPKTPIPTIGWLAYFKDTEGNVFGIMQPDESAG